MAMRKHCDICDELVIYPCDEFSVSLHGEPQNVIIRLRKCLINRAAEEMDLCRNCTVRIMSQIVEGYTKNSG